MPKIKKGERQRAIADQRKLVQLATRPDVPKVMALRVRLLDELEKDWDWFYAELKKCVAEATKDTSPRVVLITSLLDRFAPTYREVQSQTVDERGMAGPATPISIVIRNVQRGTDRARKDAITVQARRRDALPELVAPPHMSENTKEYSAHPSMKLFHDSDADVKALCGPVGSGKSTAAGLECFLLCRESTVPVRMVVIRESYRQLHDSTRATLQEWFPEPLGVYHKGDECLRITFPNFEGEELTHTLNFRHCRRPEDVSNLLSTEYGAIWLEEVVPAYQKESGVIGAGLPKELFDMALMRVRQRDMHRRELLVTFNPPSRFHWAYDTFFKPSKAEMDEAGYALFRSPPYENAPHLPPGYYQKLLRTLGEDAARRFVMGEVMTLYPGRRVFRDVYEQVHFDEKIKPVQGVPLVFGFDFGRTPCVLIGQVLPSSRLQIYREVQMFDSGITRLAEQLREVLKAEFPGHERWRCWGDPSGAYGGQQNEDTCFSILAAHGFAVHKGAEEFVPRFEAVQGRLTKFIDGRPALLIDPAHCPLLTEGLLGAYRFAPSTDGRYDRKPLKNHPYSDLCDALQYLCTGEFAVTTGDAKHTLEAETKLIPTFNPFEKQRARSGPNSWMGR